MSLSKDQRVMRARLAAYSRWAREDPAEQVAKMRDGFQARFEREVDPDRKLPERERRRRAQAAMRAHMTRLAYASSRARSTQ